MEVLIVSLVVSFVHGEGPGKVGSLLGVLQPCLVLVVSVLDVLRQPVLGPVDLLAANRDLQVLQHHPELVVFGLVVHTVVVLDIAEPLLLKVKVLLHVVLQHLELSGVLRLLGNCKDVGKQHIVFLVEPAVVNLERLIPHVGLRGLVLQCSLVAKVGVLDVLGKPVLGPLDLAQVDGSVHPDKPH